MEYRKPCTSFLVIFFVLLMGTFALSGCKKAAPPAQPGAPAPQAAAAQAPTSPVGAPPPPQEGVSVALEYRYDPIGKPDPFEPFDFSRIGVFIPTSPLQQFELNQLKLVGIIWGIPDARALIEDPAGKGYIIQRGTKVGKNDGTVIRILADEIVVLEKYEDFFTGKIRTNEVSMKLLKSEGGLAP